MATELTPMMRQYLEMKEKNKDCLLFFRLGDFYEMFNEDAKLVSKELDLTLTTRDRSKDKEDQTPMCGVPYHSAEAYIARLVAKGYKVAICEQTEDPATAKGLVDRDIVRIVTPGTVTESSMLDESRNNYMASLFGLDGAYGLCFCDLSTGAFYATGAQGPEAVARVAAELGRFAPAEVIRGGQGVGRVTKPGLDQPVGEAAINRVPRQMIREAVEAACRTADYDGGAEVTISVPEGEAIAQKTFNPQMGIVGGISILGTSGIVEPMSMQAMIDTMALELRQAAAQGHRRLILTPGNYGQDFLTRHGLDGLGVPVVKCANFIGDALDQAAAEGFESVLLVGHVGKLVKLAGGIMNTHSRYADCRTELFCAYAAVCGGGQALCEALLDSATTDACIALLDQAGLRAPVMARLLTAIDGHVRRRAAGAYPVGVLLFSNVYGVLGRTEGYEEVLHEWKKG